MKNYLVRLTAEYGGELDSMVVAVFSNRQKAEDYAARYRALVVSDEENTINVYVDDVEVDREDADTLTSVISCMVFDNIKQFYQFNQCVGTAKDVLTSVSDRGLAQRALDAPGTVIAVRQFIKTPLMDRKGYYLHSTSMKAIKDAIEYPEMMTVVD